MHQKSLKKNAILNVIKTLMSVIFPLVTFPYASRVLSPEGIGRVNFATSIISYFALLASLGINSYGVREGAKIRGSKENLSVFSKEIFSINMVSTILAYIFLGFAITAIPKLQEYASLLIVCSTTILFSTLGMEWLYTAVEDFAYITVRSVVFQFLSLILLLLFVHDSNDILKYAAISVFSSVGSNILNFIHARKYVSFRGVNVKVTALKRHILPITILFVMALTSSIYTILDTSMLGFLTTDYQVGIYTAATKVNRIVLNVVVSVGAVLMPRLAYYYGTNDKNKFSSLAYKSVDLLLMTALPAAIGLSILAPSVLLVISGEQYSAAIPVMQIINPIIVVVGLSNFVGVQIFMPLGKEKWTLYSDIAGASINIVLNALLIPRFGAMGAAIASVSAEVTVTGVQLFLAKSYLSLKIIFKKCAYYFLLSIGMGAAVLITQAILPFRNHLIKMILGILCGMLVYIVELFLTKNEWTQFAITYVKEKRK